MKRINSVVNLKIQIEIEIFVCDKTSRDKWIYLCNDFQNFNASQFQRSKKMFVNVCVIRIMLNKFDDIYE